MMTCEEPVLSALNPHLRIGIDGRALQGKRTGIGRYAFELCRCLDRCLPHARFFVYSYVPVEMPVSSNRWHLRTDASPFSKYMRPILWLKFRAGRLCYEDRLDAFWATAMFLPKLHSRVRTVITVYDLNFKVAPETMGNDRWLHRCFFARDVRKADRVLAISRGTSDRLGELVGREAAAIVQPAVGEAFRPQAEETVSECLETYHIRDPYILAVATWEPRKNLERLIRAFLDLKHREALPRHKLVLVGGRGWKDERLAALVHGEGRQTIMPLGYVPDAHLPPLYAGADVFVFPSIYEGFGMPVLEARACGTRTVATDIPELREAGGPDTVYITATVEGISDGILRALSQRPEEKANEWILPTWEQGARVLAAALVNDLHSA